MPYSSLRKCTFPGCNVLVKRGRCPAHSTKKVQRNPAVKKLYNDPRWRAMRAAQLAKDPWCADCMKEGAHTLAKEADHIIPHEGDVALFFDEDNLQSLCKPHHSRKTAKEVLHA